jgi:ATP-binding cassette subfamily B protein
MYILISIATKRILYKNSKSINSEMTNVLRSIQEGLGGIRDILIDGSQYLYSKIYQKSDYSLREAQAGNQFIAVSPRYIMESLGMVLIALLAFSIAYQENGVAGAIPILGVTNCPAFFMGL